MTTDRDRERAAWVLLGIPDAEDRVAYMVEQLAVERARVLAPVLAVAASWEVSAKLHDVAAERARSQFDLAAELVHGLTATDLSEHADRIRRAAQDGAQDSPC